MAPTLDDIAKLADVSKSTVSLVLNDKPGVSAELKQTVLRAATELGYRTAQTRSAQRGSPRNQANKATTYSIAVVHAQSSHKAASTYEPTDLYLNYLKGIRAFAQASNLNLTVLTGYNEEDARQLAFHLLHNSTPAFDGLLLMGGSAQQNRQLISQILENGLPTVALSRAWPDLPISTVGPDYRQQVRLALDYLAGLGHRHIAFIASEDDQRFDWYRWRLDAYREAIYRHNGTVDEELIVMGDTGAAATQILLQQRPDTTAIFAINDERALEAWAGLQQNKYQVPQDISLIGQDNVIELMGHHPKLTTVSFPHVDVGYLATELLVKQMGSPQISHCNCWVQCSLVVRASCDKPKR